MPASLTPKMSARPCAWALAVVCIAAICITGTSANFTCTITVYTQTNFRGFNYTLDSKESFSEQTRDRAITVPDLTELKKDAGFELGDAIDSLRLACTCDTLTDAGAPANCSTITSGVALRLYRYPFTKADSSGHYGGLALQYNLTRCNGSRCEGSYSSLPGMSRSASSLALLINFPTFSVDEVMKVMARRSPPPSPRTPSNSTKPATPSPSKPSTPSHKKPPSNSTASPSPSLAHSNSTPSTNSNGRPVKRISSARVLKLQRRMGSRR